MQLILINLEIGMTEVKIKKEHPGLRTGAAAAHFSQLTNIGEEKSQKCNNNDTGGHKKTDRQVSEEKRGDTIQDNHDIRSKSLSAPTKDDHVTNDNFTAAAKSGKKHQDEGPAIMSAASSLMIEGGIHALIHNNKTATTGAPEPKNVPPLHTPGNDKEEKDPSDLGKSRLAFVVENDGSSALKTSSNSAVADNLFKTNDSSVLKPSSSSAVADKVVKTDDETSLPPATKPAESGVGVGGREVLRPKAVKKVKSKQAVVTKAVKSAAAVSEAATAEVSRFRRSGAPEPGSSNRSSAINNTVKTN